MSFQSSAAPSAVRRRVTMASASLWSVSSRLGGAVTVSLAGSYAPDGALLEPDVASCEAPEPAVPPTLYELHRRQCRSSFDDVKVADPLAGDGPPARSADRKARFQQPQPQSGGQSGSSQQHDNSISSLMVVTSLPCLVGTTCQVLGVGTWPRAAPQPWQPFRRAMRLVGPSRRPARRAGAAAAARPARRGTPRYPARLGGRQRRVAASRGVVRLE